MKRQSELTGTQRSKKGKAFDSSAFYAQVAESTVLTTEVLNGFLDRLCSSGDSPKTLFGLLADYCGGRKREWQKLHKAIPADQPSFASRVFERLCQLLDVSELSPQWRELRAGSDSVDAFLELATHSTPNQKKELEAWLKARKQLPILALAMRLRDVDGAFDRIAERWLLKMDTTLRGNRKPCESLRADSHAWLELVLGTKRSPRTLNNYFAPLALAWARTKEALRFSENLERQCNATEANLREAENKIRKLEDELANAAGRDKEQRRQIEEKERLLNELRRKIEAEIGLGESNARNSVGRQMSQLRRKMEPDLDDLEQLLDRPNPNVGPCLRLVARIKKNLIQEDQN